MRTDIDGHLDIDLLLCSDVIACGGELILQDTSTGNIPALVSFET
jgi:hypothetical protein